MRTHLIFYCSTSPVLLVKINVLRPADGVKDVVLPNKQSRSVVMGTKQKALRDFSGSPGTEYEHRVLTPGRHSLVVSEEFSCG